LYLFLNLLTVLVGISLNSFLLIWIIIELNLLSFLGLIIRSNLIKINLLSIKYFCIQATSSLIIYWGLLMGTYFKALIPILLLSAIFIKLGIAPFHAWFIRLLNKSSWSIILFLSISQKIIPLWFLCSYYQFLKTWFQEFILIRTVISRFLRIFQILIKKILAYSSIFMLNWVCGRIFFRKIFWFQFIAIYTILLLLIILIFIESKLYLTNFSIVATDKTFFIKIIIILLTMAGIPPLVIFYIKFAVIYSLVYGNFYSISIILLCCSIFLICIYLSLFSTYLKMSATGIWLSLNYKISKKISTRVFLVGLAAPRLLIFLFL